MKANRFKQYLINRLQAVVNALLAVWLLLTIPSCFPPHPDEQYKGGFSLNDENVCLAVMNFDYSGYGLSSKLAMSCADNLTSELFITKKVNVIDRNLVREILARDENVSQDKFSRDDIRRIGSALKATHIIFGSLYSAATIEEYYQSEKYHFDLTVRIVEIDHGDVVGIIKKSASNENTEKLLKTLVNKVVKSM